MSSIGQKPQADVIGPVSVADATAIEDLWAPYFGRPAGGPLQLDPYERTSEATMNLPKAYQGNNAFLGNLVRQYFLTGDSFYTQALAPTTTTIDRRIEWNEWTFDQHALALMPHQGVPPLLRSERKGRSGAVRHYGIMFRLEHGFHKSADGKEAYHQHMRQTGSAVQESANRGVILALLQSDDVQKTWEAQFGYIQPRALEDALRQEVNMFAIIQKEKNGIIKMDAHVTKAMEFGHGEGDTWVFPLAVKQFVNLVPTENTDFFARGPAGPKLLTQPRKLHDSSKFFGELSGNRVYFTRVFDIAQARQPANLLERERHIGEFFTMVDRYSTMPATGYTTAERSIEIYSEDTDSYVQIDPAMALEHCHMFDKVTGKLSMRKGKTHHKVYNYDQDLKNKHPFFMPVGKRGGVSRKTECTEIECWGQMREKHLKPHTIMRVVETLLARAERGNSGTGFQAINNKCNGSLARAIENGLRVHRQLSNKTPSVGGISAWRDAVLVAIEENEPTDSTNDGRYHAIPAVKEYRGDSVAGTFIFPSVREGEEESRKLAYSMGFTNWDGYRALAQEHANSTDFSAVSGLTQNTLDHIANFVAAVEHLVGSTRGVVTSDAIFLDPGHTNPAFPRMSAESVFVENLLGTHQMTIWLRAKNADPIGDRSGTPDVDAELEAYLNLRNLTRDTPAGATFTQLVARLRGEEIPEAARRTAIADILARLLIARSGPKATFTASDTQENEARLARFMEVFRPFLPQGTRASEPVDMERVYAYVLRNYHDFAFASPEEADGFIRQRIRDLRPAPIQGHAGVRGQALTHDKRLVRTPLTMSGSQFLKLFAGGGESPVNWAVSTASNLGRPMNIAEMKALAQQLDRVSKGLEVGDTNVHSLMMSPMTNKKASSQLVDVLPLTLIAQAHGAASSNVRGGALFADERRVKRARYNIGAHAASASSRRYDDYGASGGGMIIEEEYPGHFEPAGGSMHDGMQIMSKLFNARFQAQYQSVDRGNSSTLERALAKVFLGTPINQETCRLMLVHNIVFPMGWAVFRPHQRYTMAMGIKMKRGAETARTFVGAQHFLVGDDVITEVHYAKYSLNMATMVLNPKNVAHAHDLLSLRALGGGGSIPVTFNNGYNPEHNKYGKGSLFFAPLHAEERINRSFIDCSGRLNHLQSTLIRDTDSLTKLHYSTAATTNALWGFQRAQDVGVHPLQPFFHPVYSDGHGYAAQFKNTICWQGEQHNYNRATGEYSQIIHNQGHWGHNCYPGVLSARNGALTEMRGKHMGNYGVAT